MTNLYDVLGVAKDADADAIKQAYRRKASGNHPDREGGNVQAMAAVNNAYEVLSDDVKRARYDECGETSPKPSAETEAREALMKMFLDAVNKGAHDPHEFVQQNIEHAGRQLDTQTQQAQERLKNLEAMRTKVSAKGPDNLYEMVVNQLIRSAGDQLDTLREAAIVKARVVELFNEYESKAEPEPGPGVFWRGLARPPYKIAVESTTGATT